MKRWILVILVLVLLVGGLFWAFVLRPKGKGKGKGPRVTLSRLTKAMSCRVVGAIKPRKVRYHRGPTYQNGCVVAYKPRWKTDIYRETPRCGDRVKVCGKTFDCRCPWQTRACTFRLRRWRSAGVCHVMLGPSKGKFPVHTLRCGESVKACGKVARCGCNYCAEVKPVRAHGWGCSLQYVRFKGKTRALRADLLGCKETRKVCGKPRLCSCAGGSRKASPGSIAFRSSLRPTSTYSPKGHRRPFAQSFYKIEAVGTSGLKVAILSYKRDRSPSASKKRSYTWDPATRTLRLVHALRNARRPLPRTPGHYLVEYHFDSLPYVPRRLEYVEQWGP